MPSPAVPVKAKPNVVVVDYSKGNLRSVEKGLARAGADAWVSAEPEEIAIASAIVLPGVGSFADASATMIASGQMQVIRERVQAGVPFLGICLGLQLLFERGDEGVEQPSQEPNVQNGEVAEVCSERRWAQGLALLRGSCARLAVSDNQGRSYKVPHVGWNQVCYRQQNGAPLSPLFNGIADSSNFYFTHSYQVVPLDANDVIAETRHAQSFTSAVQREHIFGTQFHPEKSSRKGLAVLQNFVDFVRNEA